MISFAVLGFAGRDELAGPEQRLASVTRPSKRMGGSPTIPLSDPRNTPRAVEQVHLTGGSSESVHVCWASHDTGLSVVELSVDGGPFKEVAGGYGSIYSALQDPAPYYPDPGTPTCLGGANYTNPECYYTSPVLHSVELLDLRPASQYSYRVKGDSLTFGFTTPPKRGAPSIRFGVTADLGQTLNSTATVDGLLCAQRSR